MKTPRYLWIFGLALFLGLALVACGPAGPASPSPEMPSPSPTSPVATSTPMLTFVPSTRTPTVTPKLPPSMYTEVPLLPSPCCWYCAPYPVLPSREDEIMAALQEYGRIRAEAERTLNPDLLRQVCVDPYLSEKAERIRANARDGSHWETVESATFFQDIDWEDDSHVRVRVEKRETKLFFPRGSSVPDDEICSGAIYSYRGCTYGAEYRMVLQEGRWYVAVAQALGECPSVCRKGLPTPTATPTPTPTPRRAAEIIFPTEATQPSGWPALPLDLYFLRTGRLWRWPAAGGTLEKVRAPGAPISEQVEYRLSPDERYLAYLTSGSYLYVVDRQTGEQAFPKPGATAPTVYKYAFSPDGGRLLYVNSSPELYLVELSSGDSRAVSVLDSPEQFALTPDGRYLVYLSVPPGALSACGAGWTWFPDLPSRRTACYGTLFAIDLQNSYAPYDLGFCGPAEGQEARVGCLGFLVSPDGRELAFADERGVWLSQIPNGNPRMIAPQPSTQGVDEGNNLYIPLAWLPDGQRMLAEALCYQKRTLVALEGGRPAQAFPNTACLADCHVEWTWGEEGLWISPIPGRLYQALVSPEGAWQILESTVDTGRRRLWPTQLKVLSGGRLAFAQQRCAVAEGGADPWPAPGLFVLEPGGSVRRVAPLPLFPCAETGTVEQLLYPGTVVWSEDGSAFLYLDREGRPMLLGRTDGSALWDVRTLLAGAGDFRWARP
ncbi:MAG: TolB family protein [Chloroflexia bacterium]